MSFILVMIRAVLDTNILLSSLRSRAGASHQILLRLAKQEFELVIGNTVLAEYEEVLKRECPKIGVSASIVERFLDTVCAASTFFPTSSYWKPALPDADDEVFAQLALEAKVGYLVTCNTRHFPPDRLPGLQVSLPREFLKTLKSRNP